MEIKQVSYRVWEVEGQTIYHNRGNLICNCKFCRTRRSRAKLHGEGWNPFVPCIYIKALLKYLEKPINTQKVEVE